MRKPPGLILPLQQRGFQQRPARLLHRRLRDRRGGCQQRHRLWQCILRHGDRHTHGHGHGAGRAAVVRPDLLQQHGRAVLGAGVRYAVARVPVRECGLWVWAAGLREWGVRHGGGADGDFVWELVLRVCYGGFVDGFNSCFIACTCCI